MADSTTATHASVIADAKRLYGGRTNRFNADVQANIEAAVQVQQDSGNLQVLTDLVTIVKASAMVGKSKVVKYIEQACYGDTIEWSAEGTKDKKPRYRKMPGQGSVVFTAPSEPWFTWKAPTVEKTLDDLLDELERKVQAVAKAGGTRAQGAARLNKVFDALAERVNAPADPLPARIEQEIAKELEKVA